MIMKEQVIRLKKMYIFNLMVFLLAPSVRYIWLYFIYWPVAAWKGQATILYTFLIIMVAKYRYLLRHK
jgi:hypothetical protein